MGIDFRTGKYTRHVWFGKRTIKEGESAIIWNLNGKHVQIHGPRRQYLFFSTIRFLDRFTAREGEYLELKYKDGRVEHQKGPVTMFLDPVVHDDVKVCQAVRLVSSSECLIVYSKPSDTVDNKEGDKKVHRRIMRGPAVFFPRVDEWVHRFKWRSGEFDLLETKSLIWTYDSTVRTQDNVEVKISGTVTIDIVSVENLLSQTKDPQTDVLAAIQRDLQLATASITLERIQLVMLIRDFPALNTKCTQVGLSLVSLSIVGYKLPDKIEQHQNDLSAKQASLLSEQKMAKQKHELEFANMDVQMKRAEVEFQMRKTKQDQEIALLQQRDEAEQALERAKNQVKLDYYKGLSALNVNLTDYLVAQYRPSVTNMKVDQPQQQHK